jgi:hypothetical protein
MVSMLNSSKVELEVWWSLPLPLPVPEVVVDIAGRAELVEGGQNGDGGRERPLEQAQPIGESGWEHRQPPETKHASSGDRGETEATGALAARPTLCRVTLSE